MVHVLFVPADVSIDDLSVQFGTGFFQGTPYQRGGRIQRGAGVGDILRRLWRFVLPLAAKAGKAAAPVIKELGREGLMAGSRVMSDVANGGDLKESVINEGRQGLKNVVHKIQSGQGVHKRKRPAKGVIVERCTRKGRSCSVSVPNKKLRRDALGLY